MNKRNKNNKQKTKKDKQQERDTEFLTGLTTCMLICCGQNSHKCAVNTRGITWSLTLINELTCI